MHPAPSLSTAGNAVRHALVCVVDDDDSLRRSLARLFRSAHLTVETFDSARSYLARSPHDGPVCLVLDIRMPGLNGLDLQRALADRSDQIVFLTSHGSVPLCAEAMKAGAVDFLTKPVEDAPLLAAVRLALERSAHARWQARYASLARNLVKTLTPREVDVMRAVIAGLLNKQIADRLGSAEKTVKIHRGRVMHKLGVTSVAELVRMAQLAGLEPLPRDPDVAPFPA